MFTPPPRSRPLSVTITPFAQCAVGLSSTAVQTPASGTWSSANAAVFLPIRLEEAFTVAKAFVLNGATTGTDSWDLGIYKMTDYSTGRLDLIRSTGAVLSSGTANACAEVSAWKVARVNLTSAGDSTDQDTYTTSSVTLKAGRLYCMGVENSHASSAPAVSSITGGGTWTSRASVQYNGTLNRISLWTSVPTTDYTGTIAIFFGTTSGNTGAVWALDEMSGVDTSTNDGIVQTATGTGSSTTPLATLSAFGSANNASYGVAGHAANTTSTAGTGFTELADVGTATPAQAIHTEWQVGNDTTVDSTITSAAWGAIGAEIKADASSFVIPPSLYGDASIYWAMSVSGTTATFFRSSTFVLPQQRAAGMLEKTSSFPLPSNVTPVALTSSRFLTLAGFSVRSLLA